MLSILHAQAETPFTDTCIVYCRASNTNFLEFDLWRIKSAQERTTCLALSPGSLLWGQGYGLSTGVQLGKISKFLTLHYSLTHPLKHSSPVSPFALAPGRGQDQNFFF